MSVLVVYWCHFPLMISSFRGRWICTFISRNHLFVPSLILMKTHLLWFVYIDVEADTTSCFLQTMPQAFGWAGVFTRSALSSAYAASVMVCAGYRLLQTIPSNSCRKLILQLNTPKVSHQMVTQSPYPSFALFCL